MWDIFLFRAVVFVLGFTLSARKWGDWKHPEQYYPTILFTMVVSLSASYLTYHHALWNYSPDAVIKTHTMLEFINCFVILPSAVFLYLSRYPSATIWYQFGYIALWVLLFSSLEFIDHYLVGGIYYTNGWSWQISTLFDVAIFSIWRLHYLKPAWAWLITLLLTGIIVVIFNLTSAEMK
jgi:hypothetical protein